MSKDRKPRYFDFIHQHEERLNSIYSRWEDQIEQQNAANGSQTLVGRIKSHKKTVIAGMAIAFGSVLLAGQCEKQANSSKAIIASNSQKLEQMNWKLQDVAASRNHMACVLNNDIYQLTSGSLNHHTLTKQPRSFINQANTISVIRHSIDVRQPDAYLRLNPDRNLLFGSIEQTQDTVQTTAQVIDLDEDIANMPNDRQTVDNYRQVQEKAIALHEELSQCLVENNVLNTGEPFSPFLYAD